MPYLALKKTPMKNKLSKTFVWDKLLIALCYSYIGLPIVIFFFGWLKIYLAIIFTSIVVIGMYIVLKKFNYIEIQKFIDLRFITLLLGLIIVWIIFSGIGGFGHQNWDFNGRNAIFRDLINNRWPVLYDYSEKPGLQEVYGDTGALVYYLIFWLPSALVGKLFGWKIANLSLFFWTVLGVLLTLMLITRYFKKAKFLIVILFILFSGMDYIGKIIANWDIIISQSYAYDAFSITKFIGEILFYLVNTWHIEWWAGHLYQYSSFTSQLFFVFNQSIPAWIITLLLLNQDDRKSLIFTYSLMFLSSPLPAIGLLPYLIYKMFGHSEFSGEKLFVRLKRDVLNVFSYQNILVPLVISIVAILFFGTSTGNHPHGFIWNMTTLNWGYYLVLFSLFEYLLFSLFIFDGNQNKGILILTIVILSIIPLYSYGKYNDFVMRVSIPPLTILFTVGFNNIFSKYEIVNSFKKQAQIIILSFILVIGSINPLHEILRSRDKILEARGFPPYQDEWVTFGEFHNSESENYVISAPETTFFFGKLARLKNIE